MMEIGNLNQRIAILENTVKIDEIGNHKARWEEVFSCWASVAVKGSAENSDTGVTQEVQTLEFTVRHSSQTANISTSANRILFQNCIYDIKSVTPNYRYRNYIKITAETRRAGVSDDIY